MSISFNSAFLVDQKQVIKIGSPLNGLSDVLFGAFVFALLIHDSFYTYYKLDYASYADNITPYATRQNYDEAILFLEPTLSKLFFWFQENGIVAFLGKGKFFISFWEEISLRILNNVIVLSNFEDLAGITIHSDLLITSIPATFVSKISKTQCPSKIIEIFNSR